MAERFRFTESLLVKDPQVSTFHLAAKIIQQEEGREISVSDEKSHVPGYRQVEATYKVDGQSLPLPPGDMFFRLAGLYDCYNQVEVNGRGQMTDEEAKILHNQLKIEREVAQEIGSELGESIVNILTESKQHPETWQIYKRALGLDKAVERKPEPVAA